MGKFDRHMAKIPKRTAARLLKKDSMRAVWKNLNCTVAAPTPVEMNRKINDRVAFFGQFGPNQCPQFVFTYDDMA